MKISSASAAKIAFGLLLSATFSLRVFATSYCGTITQTITFTDDPAFYVGQIVTGLYRYDAQTVDGDFGTLQYCDFTNSLATPTLDGSVFGFFNWTSDGWLPFDDTGFLSRTHLVVSAGLVVDFSAQGQIGGGDYGFGFSDFNISNLNFAVGSAYSSQGSLSFSAPVAVSDGAGPTIALLSFGLFGLALIKRRRKLRGAE